MIYFKVNDMFACVIEDKQLRLQNLYYLELFNINNRVGQISIDCVDISKWNFPFELSTQSVYLQFQKELSSLSDYYTMTIIIQKELVDFTRRTTYDVINEIVEQTGIKSK